MIPIPIQIPGIGGTLPMIKHFSLKKMATSSTKDPGGHHSVEAEEGIRFSLMVANMATFLVFINS